MKTVVISISPDGTVVIEDEHGGSPEAVADLEQALGTVTEHKRTCSIKKKKEILQKVVQRG